MRASKDETSALISIILPVFNGEKYLVQAIQSCLDQTYRNLELVIVDDDSTDKTLEIAEEFAAKDSRIKIKKNVENIKLPASLNVGHQMATGAYLTWISDDNFFEPEALEIMYNAILREAVGVVYSDFRVVEENGGFIRSVAINHSSNLLLENSIGVCFLYTRQVYEMIGGYDEKLHTIEDYDFWLRLSLCCKFYHVEKVLYNFRRHSNSLSSKLPAQDHEFNKKLVRVYCKFFTSIGQEKYSALPQVFANIHQYKEINIASFLTHDYRLLIQELRTVRKVEENRLFQNLEEGLDLRFRDIILSYPKNQNMVTLWTVLTRRPQLLFKYDSKRTLKLIKACIG